MCDNSNKISENLISSLNHSTYGFQKVWVGLDFMLKGQRKMVYCIRLSKCSSYSGTTKRDSTVIHYE